MGKQVLTKYSKDKEYYYEISERADKIYEINLYKRIVYDDTEPVIVTYHSIEKCKHISDTIERAVEIGENLLTECKSSSTTVCNGEYKRNKMSAHNNKLRNFMRILLTVENVFLLPCVVLSIYRFIGFCGVNFNYSILNDIFLAVSLPIVTARIFYIPYIWMGVCFIGYIIVINKQYRKIKIVDIVLWIICLIGLLSLELVFESIINF